MDLLKYIENNESFSLDQLHMVMCSRLGEYLKEIGFIRNNEVAALCASEFCPHHVSHYLGMDIHDSMSVGRNIPLEPGVIFTVEPGESQSNRFYKFVYWEIPAIFACLDSVRLNSCQTCS